MKVVGGEMASDHRYQKANDNGGFPQKDASGGGGGRGVGNRCGMCLMAKRRNIWEKDEGLCHE